MSKGPPDLIYIRCPPVLPDGTRLEPCLVLRAPTLTGSDWLTSTTGRELDPGGVLVLESVGAPLVERARREGLVVEEGEVLQDIPPDLGPLCYQGVDDIGGGVTTVGDPEPIVLAVGKPVPDALRPSEPGIGFVGPPDALHLVLADELTAEERETIATGDYRFAVKLVGSDGLAGLVWKIAGSGVSLTGFAPYSLRHVRERLGADVAQRYRDAAKRMSLADHPDLGLLLPLVFVDPATDVVIALRAFTLPRLFSDRFLRAIVASEDQDPETSDATSAAFLVAPGRAWSLASPGVAVAGETTEVSEGDWSRMLRDDRDRRRRSRS